jgi:hypothetical protein
MIVETGKEVQNLLSALACYLNNPKCKWATLNDKANKAALRIFTQWMAKNHWVKPWDGFIEIVKRIYPTAKTVSKNYMGDNVLAIFTYYGDTWAICE